MSLDACMMRCPATTRSPELRIPAAAGELLQHRLLRLLHLQDERIVPVAAEQQRDPRTRADAAHPHDLASDLDEPELVEKLLAIVLQGAAVLHQESVEVGLQPSREPRAPRTRRAE